MNDVFKSLPSTAVLGRILRLALQPVAVAAAFILAPSLAYLFSSIPCLTQKSPIWCTTSDTSNTGLVSWLGKAASSGKV